MRGEFTYWCALAKHCVASNTTCDEGVKVALLASIQFALEDQENFIDGHEFRELQRVRPCCTQDAVDTRTPWLVGEECSHHQCMREANLDSIDNTVASTFDHGQEVVIPRAEVS